MRGIRRGVVLAALTVFVAGCGEEGRVDLGGSFYGGDPVRPYLAGQQSRIGFSVRNAGEAELRVTGFGDRVNDDLAPGNRRMGPKVNGGTGPRVRFRPFDLAPGEERYVELTYTVRGDCGDYSPGVNLSVVSVPVRYRTAGDDRTKDLDMRDPARFRGSNRCRDRGP